MVGAAVDAETVASVSAAGTAVTGTIWVVLVVVDGTASASDTSTSPQLAARTVKVRTSESRRCISTEYSTTKGDWGPMNQHEKPQLVTNTISGVSFLCESGTSFSGELIPKTALYVPICAA